MTRQERRRKRLKMLINEAGKQVYLAELANTDPSYISQMLNGHSNIGDDVAERLESSMHKPDGWMDQWLPDEGGWAFPQRTHNWHLFDRYESIEDESMRKAIRDQIIAASKPATERKKARRRKTGS